MVAEPLSVSLGSLATVGSVLFEAVVLYVGYGVLERVVGPALIGAVVDH